MVKAFVKVFFLALVAVIVGGCGLIAGQEEGSFDFQGGRGRQELNTAAGSEIEVLEPIIEDYAEDQQMTIHIDYMGSLDMMNQLQTGQIDYDAVWPASSIWIDLGDSHKILKHEEVTPITPVIFGIRESLAQDLDLAEGEVFLEDIIQAIKEDQLSFAMTSATQSNSGAMAYLGFLNALNGGQTLTEEDLQDDQLQEDIQTLLSAVDRSSGSSNWLVDLFLNGDYNAMVNYEQLILQTNEQLEDQGREPLALVYPKDALALSDSLLAYVDHGDDDKEQAFLAFQDYILSDEGQSLIEQTGKRSAFGTVCPENRELYDKWGLI